MKITKKQQEIFKAIENLMNLLIDKNEKILNRCKINSRVKNDGTTITASN